ncbi:MAG: aminoacyl--tRNA ligase-related protein [Patescibacteria group bacterium]
MLQSKLFTKSRKESPQNEVSKNARFLIQAGFIDKLQSGVYTYLPLGLRVLKNIENIIRDEMNKAGGQEILMPSLQPKENWETTGRWETMDDLYKVKDGSGRENALGPTHEEVVVPLAKQFISSYRDLPMYVYQIQNKFRMELRAKSGILRGREFLMKDLYSFHENEADLARYYDVMKNSYKNIFDRAGIGALTYLTLALGGSFSKYSHEFQTITPAGEDTIYACDKCKIAVNKEIISEQTSCPNCGSTDLKEKTSIEVGNIFKLKTKFSEPFNLVFKDKEGNNKPVTMGCYGIGLGRVMGAIVEALSDERGIIWPKEVAPFMIHLIDLSKEDNLVGAAAKRTYECLQKRGLTVLYDERKDISAGEKFADADLIGIPYRAVISEKSILAGGVEVKEREEKEVRIVSEGELINFINKR